MNPNYYDELRPNDATIIALSDEVVRAREKFPRQMTVSVVTEEMLELVEKMLLLVRSVNDEVSIEKRREEALQLACTAIRYYEECD